MRHCRQAPNEANVMSASEVADPRLSKLDALPLGATGSASPQMLAFLAVSNWQQSDHCCW